ncbi:hypothetical protein [Streptomyces sp. NPDC058644]|uniref:hypothetical protein n=1 Tax=unclassified Streptomyces TaxID=2593676 RepID=UPI003664EFEF
MGGATTARLGLVPGPIPLLVALAVLVGMVRGNLTLLQTTAVADRWDATRYGRLSGLLTAPVAVAGATAPFAGAALAAELGRYSAFFGVLAGSLLLACVLAAGSRSR